MARLPNTSPQTLLVLAALLQQPEQWHYGYDLSQQTGLKSGTLYPILMRLAEQGYLDSRWLESTAPGRPPRHAYKLTSHGLAFAKASQNPKSNLIPKAAKGFTP